MPRIPLYKKLNNVLREHIKSGVYKEGDLLPSENELCAIHNVTRPTVRQALNELVQEGYVKKHQGKGSIVTLPSKEVGILSIHGTTTAMGEDLHTRIIAKPKVVPWEEPFFFELTPIEKESGCIKLERIRLVKSDPVFYDITYLPNINLPRFTSRQFENRSLFEILRQQYQIEITGGRQRFKAITTNPVLKKYLHIRDGDPVLHLERCIETNRPNFYFYSSLYCNTRHFSLVGDF